MVSVDDCESVVCALSDGPVPACCPSLYQHIRVVSVDAYRVSDTVFGKLNLHGSVLFVDPTHHT